MEDAHHLIFRRGERWYAAPVGSSFEVLEIPPPTRVPGAVPPIQGVIAHRGEVIPLVDLSPEKAEAAKRAVLLRSSGGPLALSLSEVGGLAGLESGGGAMGEAGLEACFLGPALYDGLEISVVDPERLYTFLCRDQPADGRMR